MTQIAAETLGLSIDKVTFKLGDSALPDAPVEGGSFTASTIGTAVEAACQKMKAQLLELPQSVPNSPLRRLNSAQLDWPTAKSSRSRIPPGPSRSLTPCDRPKAQ